MAAHRTRCETARAWHGMARPGGMEYAMCNVSTQVGPNGAEVPKLDAVHILMEQPFYCDM